MLSKWLRSGLVWTLLSVVLVFVDQISKAYALTYLVFHEPYPVLPFLNFTLAFNRGAAFSFMHDSAFFSNWLFGGFAVLMSVVLMVWMSKTKWHEWLMNASLSLILAGAIGNLLDRLHYGFVVDFIDFYINTWHFAIFNPADAMISVGAALLIINWYRDER